MEKVEGRKKEDTREVGTKGKGNISLFSPYPFVLLLHFFSSPFSLLPPPFSLLFIPSLFRPISLPLSLPPRLPPQPPTPSLSPCANLARTGSMLCTDAACVMVFLLLLLVLCMQMLCLLFTCAVVVVADGVDADAPSVGGVCCCC